jgi:hypothetical protein
MEELASQAARRSVVRNTSGLYKQVSGGRFNAPVLKKMPTSTLIPDDGITAEQVQQLCDMPKKF